MAKIGFIGLGRMGRPMASNMQRKGFTLVVHDIVPGAVDALVALGSAYDTHCPSAVILSQRMLGRKKWTD